MKITVGHGTYPRYRYRPQHKSHWRAIETAIAPDGFDHGKRLTLHRSVRDHLNRYRANHLLWKTAPREKQAWDKLQEVVDTAGKLNRILEGLGPLRLQLEKQFTPLRPIEDMLCAVSEIEVAAAQAMSRFPHVEAKDADGNVIHDSYVSEIKRKKPGGKVVCTRKKVTLDEPVKVRDRPGGRPAEVPLLSLVARLGWVFKETTGRPASLRWRDNYPEEYDDKYHDSRFVEFLRAALSLAGRARLKRYDGHALDDLIKRSKPYKHS